MKKLWARLFGKKREPQHIVINASANVQAGAGNKLGTHYNITPSASVKPEGGQ